jgi:hypothetical protein
MLATIQSRTFCLLICCLKTKNYHRQKYNFGRGSVWVWNLFSNIKGGTQTEGVWEQGAELTLATSPLKLTTSYIIFQLNTYCHSSYVTSSLTRGCVYRSKILLILASAVILRFESRGTHGQILLSQIRNFPNLEGQVPAFISPRNRVAQLFPPGTGFPFHRLLRLAGLPWRYSTPLPHGIEDVNSRHMPINTYRGVSLGRYAAAFWISPFISIWCRCKEWGELYLHSPHTVSSSGKKIKVNLSL